MARINDPQVIHRVITGRPRVAMIGASSSPGKDSHQVLRYLLDQGFDVVPVNPKEEEILGQRCYPTLADVPGDIEVVEVFRKPEVVGEVAEAAIEKGAQVLWLQLGIVNEAAAKQAVEAGLDVVMDHCMRLEHQRLAGSSAQPRT